MRTREGRIEIEKYVDTVATNEGRPAIVCNREKACLTLNVSTIYPLSQPTNPPAPSQPLSSPDPSSKEKPASQMATLSFERVLSGYTLPSRSF